MYFNFERKITSYKGRVYSSWIIFSSTQYTSLQDYLSFFPSSIETRLRSDNTKNNSSFETTNRNEKKDCCTNFQRKSNDRIKRRRIKGWKGGEKTWEARVSHLAARRESREGGVPGGFQRAKPLISIIITSPYVFDPVFTMPCRAVDAYWCRVYIRGQGVR